MKFHDPRGGVMSQEKRVYVISVMFFVLLWFALGWADSNPAEIQCLPEQPSYQSPGGDGFVSKAGVHRNQVLLEIATATN